MQALAKHIVHVDARPIPRQTQLFPRGVLRTLNLPEKSSNTLFPPAPHPLLKFHENQIQGIRSHAAHPLGGHPDICATHPCERRQPSAYKYEGKNHEDRHEEHEVANTNGLVDVLLLVAIGRVRVEAPAICRCYLSGEFIAGKTAFGFRVRAQLAGGLADLILVVKFPPSLFVVV